jgi:gamma-glutamyltranspeptidase/glutathione hydrolase
LILAMLVTACAGALVSIAGPDPAPNVATGRKIAIASAAPEASAAGIAAFDAGGNVVDAAVAVTFAISVARPQSTGLGGGGFFLVRDARSGEVEALDAREVAPRSATRDMYASASSLDGPLAVAVPGLVAGVLDLHARRGSLPLAKLLAPAIALARDGLVVSHGLASACADRKAVLARDPAAARIFLPGGEPLKAGDRLVQEDLARTLEAIVAHGRAAFAEGPIADAIVAATEKRVTLEDLRAFAPKRREPIRGTYRGREIVSFPPPSSGGVLLVEMLDVLELFPVASLTEANRDHLLIEVMRRAYRDRAEFLGDPDFVAVPVRGLTSRAYAKELAKTIDEGKATPSAPLKPGPAREHDHTTHFSIVDGEGNAVASTQTINYSLGSCVVAPGTGVVLNDEMDDFAARPGEPNAYGLVGGDANAVAPGKRPLSSMTPTFVLEGKELTLAVGSPGGSRIITAVLETIVNRIDLGFAPELAVAAPRIHHQWMPDEVRTEASVPEGVRHELARRGHKIAISGAGSDIQAVFRTAARELTAVSDPRGEGRPAAR